MNRTVFAAAAFALGLAAAAPILAQSGPKAPAGDPEKGHKIYMETGCSACHGTIGHGGAWQGPKLAPDPLAYPLFLNQLRQPRRSMPRYGAEVLSDQEVADMYAWLKTIEPSKTPEETGLLVR